MLSWSLSKAFSLGSFDLTFRITTTYSWSILAMNLLKASWNSSSSMVTLVARYLAGRTGDFYQHHRTGLDRGKASSKSLADSCDAQVPVRAVRMLEHLLRYRLNWESVITIWFSMWHIFPLLLFLWCMLSLVSIFQTTTISNFRWNNKLWYFQWNQQEIEVCKSILSYDVSMPLLDSQFPPNRL